MEEPESFYLLPKAFLRMCRRSLYRSKVADTLGLDLTGGKLLLGTLMVRRLLRRHVLADDERNVGILIPPSVGGVLVNAAMAIDRRVAVNLNYTVTSDVLNQCIRQAKIRHVLTSRRVMERFHFEIDCELVYLEDLRPKATARDKALCALAAYAIPKRVLERMLGLHNQQPDDLLTIIFTSGSTGEPKGVMLSLANVGSNIAAIDQLVSLTKTDVLAGVLPFFHSFGYTITMWSALALEPKGVYHTNPLEARQVGEMCRKHRATILTATPTFLRSYIRRCQPEDFAALEIVLAGAEKLPVDVCDAFEQKFGVRPVEGYGCTECSPLVCANIPASRATTMDATLWKEGTVGRAVPGVKVKTVDLDTGADLGVGEPGMLYVKGPNVMEGYLDRPDLTAKAIRDGWYITGDIAKIDSDGFVQITGRESRFSKIGGEMVPHILIEETLQKVIGAGGGELKAVVTAVPDTKKGERLIVLHTHLDKTPDEICKGLVEAGLPNLWIPGTDSFCEVPEIPVLGTGKLDLKGLKNLALRKFGRS